MPVPLLLLTRILQFLLKTAISAYKHGRVVKKVDFIKIGEYIIKVTRRDVLGKDGGISQVVRIYKNGIEQEVWHIVIKAGKIIHKHLLK